MNQIVVLTVLYITLKIAAECFQREFTFPALTTNQTVKLVIFHMGHQQIVYTSLPGSGFGHRQLVFESKHFEGSASLSPAVLASTYSAVRDRLFTWAVNACLLKAGKQQGLGLMALPGEALCQIIANLPRGDVAVTASVCKRLSACASDDSVWRQVYFNEFNEELPDGKVCCYFLWDQTEYDTLAVSFRSLLAY